MDSPNQIAARLGSLLEGIDIAMLTTLGDRGYPVSRPLSTQALAKRAGVSVRRLEMLFQAALGTSPGAYYAGLRLLAARRLVTDTALPLGEVALRTGFSSLSAFSRAFRRETGTSAREARARAREGRAGLSLREG